jgi:hypothetical protein
MMSSRVGVYTDGLRSRRPGGALCNALVFRLRCRVLLHTLIADKLKLSTLDATSLCKLDAGRWRASAFGSQEGVRDRVAGVVVMPAASSFGIQRVLYINHLRTITAEVVDAATPDARHWPTPSAIKRYGRGIGPRRMWRLIVASPKALRAAARDRAHARSAKMQLRLRARSRACRAAPAPVLPEEVVAPRLLMAATQIVGAPTARVGTNAWNCIYRSLVCQGRHRYGHRHYASIRTSN